MSFKKSPMVSSREHDEPIEIGIVSVGTWHLRTCIDLRKTLFESTTVPLHGEQVGVLLLSMKLWLCGFFFFFWDSRFTQISHCDKFLYASSDYRHSFLEFFFARIIKVLIKIRALTASHWTKASEPRLRANWNSCELCAACCHARRYAGQCLSDTEPVILYDLASSLLSQFWCLGSLNCIIWVRTKMKREKRKEAMKKKNRNKRKQRKK